MDAEGYLWNCRYYGGCIVRVAPDGKIDRVIEMPVKNITTCTFGGADLKTLFVTTASVDAGPANGWPADCLRFSARSAGRRKTGSAGLDRSVRKEIESGRDPEKKEKVKRHDLKVPFRQQSVTRDEACGTSAGISSRCRTRRICCPPVRPDNIRCRQRSRQRRRCSFQSAAPSPNKTV